MIKSIFSVLWALISWLRYPLFLILGLLFIFYILVMFNIIISLIKGRRFKKGLHNIVKKKSILHRLFIDLPKRVADDRFEKNPEMFKYQGLIIFEGRQGNGKTISMIECARNMQKEFPKSKCLSNLNYKNQDYELDHWSKLINFKNGIYGIIAIMDETQNWFSSNQSKDFPPEMLQTITQNRKNRRVILGTAQNFYLLAKAIRSQATEVRRCTTLLGCLTIVRRFEPILDSEGKVVEFKKRGMYFFVHDQELRDSYDTYHVIESLSKSGFQPQIQDISNTTNVFIKNNKK